MLLISGRSSRELPALLKPPLSAHEWRSLACRHREDPFECTKKKKGHQRRAAATTSALVPFVTLIISPRRATLTLPPYPLNGVKGLNAAARDGKAIFPTAAVIRQQRGGEQTHTNASCEDTLHTETAKGEREIDCCCLMLLHDNNH